MYHTVIEVRISITQGNLASLLCPRFLNRTGVKITGLGRSPSLIRPCLSSTSYFYEDDIIKNMPTKILTLLLSLLTLSSHSAAGAPVKNTELWHFIDDMQKKTRTLTTSSIKKLVPPVTIKSENEYTEFYSGEDVILIEKIKTSHLDLRVSKGEKTASAFLSFEVSGDCITLDDIKKRYSNLQLTDYPRGKSPEEKTYYTTENNQYGQHISFGFTAKERQCLSQVVLDSDEE